MSRVKVELDPKQKAWLIEWSLRGMEADTPPNIEPLILLAMSIQDDLEDAEDEARRLRAVKAGEGRG